MFECFNCYKEYDKEDDAKKCCDKSSCEDGEIYISPKCGRQPGKITHYCLNVNHGNKDWFTWLEPEEKCPECDYVYRPR